MAQRTTSDYQYRQAERAKDAESRRIMAENKVAAMIEALEAADFNREVEQYNDVADREAVAALLAALELKSLIERPEIVASIGTDKVTLAALADAQYYTGRYGMGMNGR